MSDAPLDADAAEPSQEPPPAPDSSILTETPPLQLRHLLMMMATTMVALAAFQVRSFADGEFGWVGYILLWLLAASVAFTVWMLRCSWSRRGLPILESPGDSLLVYTALAALLALPSTAVFVLYVSGGEVLTDEIPMAASLWLMYGRFLTGTLLFAFLIYATTVPVRELRWRMVLGLIPISWLVRYVLTAIAFSLTSSAFLDSNAYVLVYHASSLLIFAAVAFAVRGDRLARRKRTWTHWLGVTVFLAPVAVYLVGTLGVMGWEAFGGALPEDAD
ncbi:MAG: hypothetical protein AAGJ46_02045 [Planctomycetota bacterium]